MEMWIIGMDHAVGSHFSAGTVTVELNSFISFDRNIVTTNIKRKILISFMDKYFIAALVIVLNIATLWQETESAKILGIFANPIRSNSVGFTTLMTELSRRNHNVTVFISALSTHSTIDAEDFNEVVLRTEYDFWGEILRQTNLEVSQLALLSESELHAAMNSVGVAALDHFLNGDNAHKLIQRNADNFTYDLIIVDIFHTEALLMLGQIHNCPVVGIVSSDFENYMGDFLDSNVPVACSPIDFHATYFENIGFWKRVANIRACLSRRQLYSNRLQMQQEQIANKHFGHFPEKMPSLTEIVADMSLLFFNNHAPLQAPRPLLPNQIPVGGIQIRPPQELPWNVKRFLDDARAGSIYINLGNILKCSHIPKDKLQILMNAIGNLKQRILWRCDDGDLRRSIPANVMLQQNTPNADILAHPHVKFYITDGDLENVQETIHRNVPILGIPIFRDQHRNMETVEKLGIGVKLSYLNLTETSLAWALHTLMNERKFEAAIRKVSATFRDRPLGALETTIYWIEHILRYQGAPHILATGTNIPWNHLYLLDLIFCSLIVIFSFTLFLYLTYRTSLYFYQRNQTNKLYAKLR